MINIYSIDRSILCILQYPISLIIPIFNEEKRLKKGIDRILACCQQQQWDFEIIVIEDGSTDRSIEIMEKYCMNDERIRMVSLPNRCGKGGAILHAITLSNKENIGFLDIDLSADPLEFTRLIPFTNEYDIVVGSRIIRDGLNPIQRPFVRSFLSKMFTIYFSSLFNVKVQDTQCGFKLFRRESVLPIISTIQTNGFAFDTEFLVRSSLHGLRIKEVPINWHHELDSKLHINKAVFNMSRDLLKIWLKVLLLQLRDKNICNNYFASRPVILLTFIRRVMTTVTETRSKIAIVDN